MKLRTKLYSKFIDIAWCCYEMNNFSATFSIMAGLDNSSVFRLKYTKEKVKESRVNKYQTLKDLSDSSQSHKSYRDYLSRVAPPSIPHIGILLTDLTFIEDGNTDIIDNKLINFHKRRLVIKNIYSFNLNQTTPYNYHRVEAIQDLIKREMEIAEGMTDDELFNISMIIEPRGWDGTSNLDGISTSFTNT